MKIKIWSASEDRFIDVEFTPAQLEAMTLFVKDQADEGEFFTPQEVAELMPHPHDEDDLFDTTAIVATFLPDGFVVEQHGHEDFIVVPKD